VRGGRLRIFVADELADALDGQRIDADPIWATALGSGADDR